jgi:hypothetical protein
MGVGALRLRTSCRSRRSSWRSGRFEGSVSGLRVSDTFDDFGRLEGGS